METAQVATLRLIGENKTEEVINQQEVAIDIVKMTYTTTKQWIVELLCMVIIEAQHSDLHHLPPQLLYKNDRYPLFPQYLRNLAMQNLSLILTRHYYHHHSIHLLDGVRILLPLVLWIPLQEVV